jgi:hypothetical protein
MPWRAVPGKTLDFMFTAIGFAKGVKMNYWHDEYMAEYHRQEILDQMEQIRLEKLVAGSRPYRPGLFERAMFNFANWMISTGKQLRERYEIPCVDCSQSPTGSLLQ